MSHVTYECVMPHMNESCHAPIPYTCTALERWGAGVETQKNVRGEIGGWGRVPFNETYALSLSTIYDLRRGVGIIKFLENGTRPQPPTSPALPYE